MNRLLLKDGFLKVLFDTIPLIALVLDQNLMVSVVNKATANFFNLTEEIIPPTQGGKVLHCIHRFDDSQGCGHGPECKNCIVRNTAMQARQGNSIHVLKESSISNQRMILEK